MGKALILVPSDRMGGAERVQRLVAVELAQRGYSVDVYCLVSGVQAQFASDLPVSCRVTYVSTVRELFGVVGLLWMFVKTLRKTRYDLAFSSHVHCNAFLSLLRSIGLLRVDKLVCRESTVVGKRFAGWRLLYYRAYYRLYGSIDRVICQTKEMRDVLLALVPRLAHDRVVTVCNPSVPVSVVRAASAVSSDPLIVAVGRLIPEKGADVLLAAFHQLLRCWPSACLHIYGDGPQRGELERIIAELRLENSAYLMGATSDPLGVMCSASLCVVSSRQEGFPNTLLEMMRANARVVSTRCADGVDQLRGVFTCEADSPDALYRAMDAALRMDVGDCGQQFDDELAQRTPRFFMRQAFDLELQDEVSV